jgi:parallel beta-helix repeat protein
MRPTAIVIASTTMVAAVLVLALSTPLIADAGSSRRGGRDVSVDCQWRNESIARALEQARAGDTIRIRGACTETLVIDKPITLDGGGTARIAPASASDDTITIDARKVTLRGLVLDAPATNQVALIDGATATIEDCSIHNASSFGVSVQSSSFGVLLGNTITNNASGVAALFGAGLRVGFRKFSDIPRPNLIADNRGAARPLGGNGVLVADNATASIIGGNEISGNNIGVLVALSGYAQVAGNEITENQIGILTASNATLLLPFASSTNPLLTALNTGANAQLGIACSGGTISGVPEGLAPAVRLPVTQGRGVLAGPTLDLATHCIDTTEARPTGD